MKKYFCVPTLLMILYFPLYPQGNCISAPGAVCVADCVPVTYTGSAPSSATYSWTSTCGTFTDPNQQDPGNHCYLTIGLCTLQIIVLDPGQAPDTCYAFVEVFQIPEGSIAEDLSICSGECASLIITFSAGAPPFAYQVEDGFNTNFYTSSGFADTISICPLFTTTYTLAAITGSGNCQGNGPFNSATVSVSPGVTASVTQNGDMLCANPPNQNYEWWDCTYTQQLSASQCFTLTQDGCLCVIVSGATGGSCPDTLCGEYLLPCNLTCDILFSDSICIGDTVIFAYTGNASTNATFDWLIDLPGNPGAHFAGNDTVILPYDQAGFYNVDLSVTDGICSTVCADLLTVVEPNSAATFGPDIVACDTCTSIYFTLSGIPPWNIHMTDGMTQYIINGVTFSPFPYVVCQPQDSTIVYTLLEVTDGLGLCPASLGDDSLSITLHEPLAAHVTQSENTICADSVNGTYTWYDCFFFSAISNSQCLTLTETTCYCLVVENGFCSDTICGTFEFMPCELTCDIVVQDSVCIGDTVMFAYTGNAGSGAVFNWLIDLPGFPATPFTGNDTVVLTYNQAGCYQASVTVFDAGCIVTCADSTCIVGPKSEVSICCNREVCDTCTNFAITLTGAAPWTVYLTDGSNIDTIPGITTSPYIHTVCPPADSAVTYSLIQVTDSCHICPAVMVGDSFVTITLHEFPTASITQSGDTLCANPPNMAGYGWYNCPAGAYLSTSQCFVPTVSGCYCVDISTTFDCVDTACIDIVVGLGERIADSAIDLFPNPSGGEFYVNISPEIPLPLRWEMYSVFGQKVDQGRLAENESLITWRKGAAPGMYILQIYLPDRNLFSKTLIHQ